VLKNVPRPISTPSATTAGVPTTDSTKPDLKGLRAPIVIGAVVATLLILGLLTILVMYLVQRKKKKADEEALRTQRLSFHPDQMLAPTFTLPRVPEEAYTSRRASASTKRESRLQRIRESIAGKWVEDSPSSREPETEQNDGASVMIVTAQPATRASVVRFEPAAPNSMLGVGRALPAVPEGAAPPQIIGGAATVNFSRPMTPNRQLPPVPTTPSTRPLPTPTITTATPLPKPPTRRQAHLRKRLVQIRGQLTILAEKVEREEIEPAVAEIVKKDLEKQVEWLERTVEGEWARGETDVLPDGFVRWMSP